MELVPRPPLVRWGASLTMSPLDAADSLDAAIEELCRARGPEKSVCPSEIARSQFPNNWRSHMGEVRDAAERLSDRGRLIVTRGGKQVSATATGGPIRLTIRIEPRPADTPIDQLRNLGPACREDFDRAGIADLAALQTIGAVSAWEAIVEARLAEGIKKHAYHAMYLYAIWGAVQDQTVAQISDGQRERFKALAAARRADHRSKGTTNSPLRGLPPRA